MRSEYVIIGYFLNTDDRDERDLIAAAAARCRSVHSVPADKFAKSYDDTFVATFNYLVNADRSTFTCANGIHLLLHENSHVSWSPANCQAYLDALRNLWNNWR